MPIVRLSRDKRGLDTIYLIDTRSDGKRSGGARVLYFWTAPPGLRVGRSALDDTRQRELERTHPDILFEWPELLKAVEAARQQAPLVLTPEARREAWRGAARGKSSQPRTGNRGDQGRALTASATTPAASRPAASPQPPPASGATALDGDQTAMPSETSKGAEPSSTRGRKRRRRSRRSAEAGETPRTADPIIES